MRRKKKILLFQVIFEILLEQIHTTKSSKKVSLLLLSNLSIFERVVQKCHPF